MVDAMSATVCEPRRSCPRTLSQYRTAQSTLWTAHNRLAARYVGFGYLSRTSAQQTRGTMCRALPI
eukprot:1952684-Rhodomonas_salina.3